MALRWLESRNAVNYQNPFPNFSVLLLIPLLTMTPIHLTVEFRRSSHSYSVTLSILAWMTMDRSPPQKSS